MDKEAILQHLRDEIAKQERSTPPETDDDRLMWALLHDINRQCGTNLRAPVDLQDLYVSGAGPIVAEAIRGFNLHENRAMLLHHLVGHKAKGYPPVPECAQLLWELYQDFRASAQFLQSPAHLDFDAAFSALKPKALAADLLTLARDPLEAREMPFTMQMLARWKLPEMRQILLACLDNPDILLNRLQAAGIESQPPQTVEQFCFDARVWALCFAVGNLKHYPAAELLARFRHMEQEVQARQAEALKLPENKGKRYDVLYRFSGPLDTLKRSIRTMEKALGQAETSAP